jgi:hypothetical protein
MKRRLSSLLLFFVNFKGWFQVLSLFLIGLNSLEACECIPTPVCERITEASVVFLGLVTDAESRTEPALGDKLKVRFAVKKVFKGLEQDARHVEGQVLDASSCDIPLIKGSQYLIFSERKGSQIELAGNCNSAIAYQDARDDLQYLRAWARGETPTVLHGVVRADVEETLLPYAENQGLAEVEILAVGSGKQYRTVTNPSGEFEIRDLRAESYTITARLPGYESTRPNYMASLTKGECVRVEVAMWNSSSLSGTLYDETGRPVKGIRVELAPWTDGELHPSKEVVTDGDGHYGFIKIPPGDYLLGVNLASGLNARTPYRTWFFPGVSGRDQAIILRIEGAQKLTQYDFQLEKSHPIRTVRVLVKWWDGRPVTNASVQCRGEPDGSSGKTTEWSKRYTNERGEAYIQVLSDREYALAVDELYWGRSSRTVQNRQSVRVPASKDPVSVQLVISRDNDFRLEEVPANMSRFND